MRTFSQPQSNSSAYFEQLSRAHKRPAPPLPREEDYKLELESMEDTDTEKHFKKINRGQGKSSGGHLFRQLEGRVPDKRAHASNADRLEKYKQAFELERLRYTEQCDQYFS